MFYVIFGTGRGENTKVNPVTHFFMTAHLSWHYLILIIVHVTKKFFRGKLQKGLVTLMRGLEVGESVGGKLFTLCNCVCYD